MKRIMKIEATTVFYLLLIILIAQVGCSVEKKGSKELPVRVKINKIKRDPLKYQGRLLIIEGEYRGWRGETENPLITRSDWAIRDETGTIYVTGKSPGLDPHRDVGKGIVVTGTLHLKGEIAYIKVKEIEPVK